MTPDTIMEMAREEVVYQEWVREEKNRILRMSDTRKKQGAWDKLFPPMQHDDSWMLTAKIF